MDAYCSTAHCQTNALRPDSTKQTQYTCGLRLYKGINISCLKLYTVLLTTAIPQTHSFNTYNTHAAATECVCQVTPPLANISTQIALFTFYH